MNFARSLKRARNACSMSSKSPFWIGCFLKKLRAGSKLPSTPVLCDLWTTDKNQALDQRRRCAATLRHCQGTVYRCLPSDPRTLPYLRRTAPSDLPRSRSAHGREPSQSSTRSFCRRTGIASLHTVRLCSCVSGAARLRTSNASLCHKRPASRRRLCEPCLRV